MFSLLVLVFVTASSSISCEWQNVRSDSLTWLQTPKFPLPQPLNPSFPDPRSPFPERTALEDHVNKLENRLTIADGKDHQSSTGRRLLQLSGKVSVNNKGQANVGISVGRSLPGGGKITGNIGANIGQGKPNLNLNGGISRPLPGGGQITGNIGANIGQGKPNLNLNGGISRPLPGGGQITGNIGANIGQGKPNLNLNGGISRPLPGGGQITGSVGANIGQGKPNWNVGVNVKIPIKK